MTDLETISRILNEKSVFDDIDLLDVAVEKSKQFLESFKFELLKIADSAISNLYTEIMPHIKGDTFENFRHQMINALSDYDSLKLISPSDAAKIRAGILKYNYDAIVNDLNTDLIEENNKLKQDIKGFLANRY